jgi:single-strand DNA-binding protein
MSQSANKVMRIVFLGGAPEVKFTPKAKPAGTFSVKVNKSWKGTRGTRREQLERFRIVCFGRLAEVRGEYLSKGAGNTTS